MSATHSLYLVVTVKGSSGTQCCLIFDRMTKAGAGEFEICSAVSNTRVSKIVSH